MRSQVKSGFGLMHRTRALECKLHVKICPLLMHRSLSFIVSFQSLYEPLSEKAMAPHSSTLAWKIPWTEEPGRLQSMGSLRVGHD